MSGDLGHDYHKKKLISLVIGGYPTWVNNAHLYAEVEDAGKFDDIIITYENSTTEQKECLCYQVKHKDDENVKITADQLLAQTNIINTVNDLRNEDNKPLGLLKYFFSYEELKRKGTSKYGTVKHVILYTNQNFNIEDFSKKGIQIEELSEVLDGTDLLLDKAKFKKDEKKKTGSKEDDNETVRIKKEGLGKDDQKVAPAWYKINEVPNLLERCTEYYVISVAKKLADCFFRKTEITNDIFPDYNGVLAKVIDVNNKKFCEKFINGEYSSDDMVKFRNIFLRVLEQRSNRKLNGIKGAIDSKIGGLNLSKDFGEGGEGTSTTILITKDRITEFLNHLVFAVNQPNGVELEKIIRDEITIELNRKKLNHTNLYPAATKAIFGILYVEMTELIQRRIPKLSIEKCREIYEKEIRLSIIQFDVKKPVEKFTGRKKELDELHEQLQSRDGESKSPRVAICGLGGVGKTEMARQYINLHSQDYEGNVVWINAETYDTLADSFRKLGKDRLEISTKDANGEDKDITSIVVEVFTFFYKKKSLFVFDNAEKLKSRSESDSESGIYDFLPNSLPLGANIPCVLITSRNQEWGERIKSLPLTVFTKDEAVELIKGALIEKDLNDELDMENLAEILQFFPLALRQAIAYINENEEFKVVDYLDEYEKESKELLDFPFPDHCEDNYTRTTFITWNITMKKYEVRQEYLALEILNIIAYFNSNNIPTGMFSKLIPDGNKKKKLRDSIKCLTKYSMVDSVKNFKVPAISIHRLVQEVIRIKLRENINDPNEKSILKKALELFKNDIDPYNVDHAEYVWNYASKHIDLVEKFTVMPSKIAQVLRNIHNFNRVVSFGKKAGELLAEIAGPDHIHTAETFVHAARAAMPQGRLGVAHELFAKVNGTNCSVLGAITDKVSVQLLVNEPSDHILTLQESFDAVMSANEPARFDATNNVVRSLYSLGYVEATLMILAKNLNDITRYNNSREVPFHVVDCRMVAQDLVGMALERLGQWQTALHIRTLQYEYSKKSGLPELSIVDTRCRMAKSMLYLGDYDGVLKIYDEIIEKLKSSENKMHTSVSMHLAARALEGLGKYNESLEIAYEAFDVLSSVDSIPDVMILPLMSHIARLWHKLDQNELAIQYYNEVIRILKKRSSVKITYHDILYTHLCIIDIERKTRSREITLSALKDLSKDKENDLDARDEWRILLEKYIARCENGEDDGADISPKFSDPTIFTDEGEKEYSHRTTVHPLQQATIKNQLVVVKCLVELAMYDVNDQDMRGGTALHWAADMGNKPIADYLLSRNAYSRMRTNLGLTPLHMAAFQSQFEIVEVLLSKGASINDQDNEGATALHRAIYQKEIPIVKYLLSKNADLRIRSNKGLTALHLAAYHGHGEIVEILLNAGAAVNEKHDKGWTALSFTTCRGRLEAAKILLNRGASVNVECDLDQLRRPDPITPSPTQLIIESVHEYSPLDVETVKAIIESTKSLFTTIKNNHLSDSEKIEKLQHCISKGAILGATYDLNCGILDYAVYQKSENLVKFLVGQGADVIRVTNDAGLTALHVAVLYDCLKIVNYLLQHVNQDKLSGFINAQDTKDRRTALHIAAERNNTDIVKILVKKGADCDIKNAQNKTALDLAEPESEVRNILVSCRQK